MRAKGQCKHKRRDVHADDVFSVATPAPGGVAQTCHCQLSWRVSHLPVWSLACSLALGSGILAAASVALVATSSLSQPCALRCCTHYQAREHLARILPADLPLGHADPFATAEAGISRVVGVGVP